VLDHHLRFVFVPDRAGGRDEALQERERGLSPLGDLGVQPIEVQTSSSLKWSNV
jgi:hypothetical protein